jgi:hypothetical protein
MKPKISAGDYIAHIDGDDYWMPGKAGMLYKRRLFMKNILVFGAGGHGQEAV